MKSVNRDGSPNTRLQNIGKGDWQWQKHANSFTVPAAISYE